MADHFDFYEDFKLYTVSELTLEPSNKFNIPAQKEKNKEKNRLQKIIGVDKELNLKFEYLG